MIEGGSAADGDVQVGSRAGAASSSSKKRLSRCAAMGNTRGARKLLEGIWGKSGT